MCMYGYVKQSSILASLKASMPPHAWSHCISYQIIVQLPYAVH